MMGSSYADSRCSVRALADPRGGREAIRPWPHHGFREGPASLPRLQKELLKVGGSWKSAGFSLASLAHYIKNII